MKRTPKSKAPADADAHREIQPVICYPVDTLYMPNMTLYAAAREAMKVASERIKGHPLYLKAKRIVMLGC